MYITVYIYQVSLHFLDCLFPCFVPWKKSRVPLVSRWCRRTSINPRMTWCWRSQGSNCGRFNQWIPVVFVPAVVIGWWKSMDGFVAATGEPGSSWIGQVDLPDDFDDEIANTQEQMQEALNGWAAQRNNRNCNGNEIAVCKWMSLEIGYSRNRWFTMVYYHFPHENCPHFGPGCPARWKLARQNGRSGSLHGSMDQWLPMVAQ